jgi:hypothetical protein
MKAAAVGFGINLASGRRSVRPGIATDLKLGWDYWRAAERDEENGFPFTAATEWQQAAECFGSIPLISDHCWREWERILHLPRHLAGPIVESNEVALPCTTAPHAPAIAKGCEGSWKRNPRRVA